MKPLLNLLSELSFEDYQEEMIEAHNNGIKVVSFELWVQKQELQANIFDELMALRESGQ